MIRRYQEKDKKVILEIWKNENIRTHKFIPKEYWENNYKVVEKILPSAEIYVYLSKGKVVGFIGINHNHIEGIFVDIHNQNKGIGTFLLNKVKEHRKKLTLCVYQKNTSAINFYQKNQFLKKEERIDPNTNEAEYVMEWERKE